MRDRIRLEWLIAAIGIADRVGQLCTSNITMMNGLSNLKFE